MGFKFLISSRYRMWPDIAGHVQPKLKPELDRMMAALHADDVHEVV